ncbi:acetylxylan esterase [Streptomyces sp. ME19-01-6]|uniref:acetylxylan esterase n=1 Tax=Streptomyces sp. ME19-01-6 TaxID=3028686 RepID=UPI0029CA3829|nr:acetylxylan esterase [Streptomyces sp. ME19-01-6]
MSLDELTRYRPETTRWLLVPRGAPGPLPVLIKYLGYTCGRCLPTDHLLPPAAGYAHLVVDSPGQGHDTPGRGEGGGTPWIEGFMTRGIRRGRLRGTVRGGRQVSAVAQPGHGGHRVASWRRRGSEGDTGTRCRSGKPGSGRGTTSADCSAR